MGRERIKKSPCGLTARLSHNAHGSGSANGKNTFGAGVVGLDRKKREKGENHMSVDEIENWLGPLFG